MEGRLYRGDCAKRLKYLSSAVEEERVAKEWEGLRTSRFINEFLLSKGLFSTAELFSLESSLAVHYCLLIISLIR